MPNVRQTIAQNITCFLCRFFTRGGRCFAQRAIGCGGEPQACWACRASRSPRLRDLSRASVRTPRNTSLWSGVRFPRPRTAERDQDAGIYIRAGRRDSRRVLRPADERVPKRVPRDQVVVDFGFSGRRAVAGEVSSWSLIGQGAMSDFESAMRCEPDISWSRPFRPALTHPASGDAAR